MKFYTLSIWNHLIFTSKEEAEFFAENKNKEGGEWRYWNPEGVGYVIEFDLKLYLISNVTVKKGKVKYDSKEFNIPNNIFKK